MGRRLNVSTPTVINTELIPLTDSFYIEADGQLEQWYYENDGRYAPNRKVTPMTLTPHISAFDKDTNTAYTPSFYVVRWYEQAWNETQQDYVETEITNIVDSLSADYVKVGNNLLVKKNVGYTHAVTITCRAQYIDPRDSGITYNVVDNVLLTTNRDATVLTPELDVECPSSQAFNPLTDNHIESGNVVYDSQFTMKATSDMSSVLATDVSQYRVDPLGTETIIPTNETSIETCAPVMDIRYGDYSQTNQKFMSRQTSGGQIPYIAGNMAYVSKIKGNTVKFNQLVDTSTTSVTLTSSHKYYTSISGTKAITTGDGSAVNVTGGSDTVIDLTDIGISDLSTVADVEAWLAQNIGLKDYYPYSAGELIPVKMSSIKTTGFNIWDEEWEVGAIDNDGQPYQADNQIRSKNFTKVSPLTDYVIKIPSAASFNGLYCYDKYGNFLGEPTFTGASAGGGLSFNTLANTSYIKFGMNSYYGDTYGNDICINIFDSSRNGTYEAHWEAEQALPVTELKSKVNGTGNDVVIFPTGMNSVGSTYDEIKADDGVIKAIKTLAKVNLGECDWTESGSTENYTQYVSTSISTTAKVSALGICSKYTYDANASAAGTIVIGSDKSISVKVAKQTTPDASAFKTSVDGVYLVYELAASVEYIIDNMPRGQFEWYGVFNNQEVLVETLPWYVSGQHTDTLVVDAMYGEEIRVVLRARVSAGANRLYPNKVYRSVIWKIPDVDTNTYSENGGAVRGTTQEMTFDTIMNIKGSVLPDAVKRDNLMLNWKVRKSNSSAEVDFGWSQRVTISAEALRNSIGASSSLASTLVLPYVYLLGARELITDSNEVVTDNGEPVYDRSVS